MGLSQRVSTVRQIKTDIVNTQDHVIASMNLMLEKSRRIQNMYNDNGSIKNALSELECTAKVAIENAKEVQQDIRYLCEKFESLDTMMEDGGDKMKLMECEDAFKVIREKHEAFQDLFREQVERMNNLLDFVEKFGCIFVL
ncbi:894_t:CDS:2 [Acaulospora morrowiae]|uniref:894_t:CDS:1 n=1 Tax=Acaulospora morrowiae TaxID=94023 RepID=A0A9N8VBT6_9GLOM|nr:894_t:CDS:2 [Acaulospora morrowiae]